MNNTFVVNSARFVVFILLQVFVFNYVSLGFLGGAICYPCIIFILMLPMHTNRIVLITISFTFGLLLDMFGNTGGAQAAACLVLAYARPLILVSSFGVSYEHQNLKFNDVDLKEIFIYVLVSCLVYHLILFSLEVFNFSHFFFILKQSLFSAVFTSVSVLIYFGLTQSKKI